MATMDDGPTMNEGQSWTSWADNLDLKSSDRDDEEEKEKITRKKHDNDAMKLRKEEMGLFGICPAWDDFFLVVCEICGRLVKPQALKGHLELRHATSLDRPWDHLELSVPHSTTSSGKSNGGGNSGSGSSSGSGSRHTNSSPSLQQPSSQHQRQHHLPPQQALTGGKSASAPSTNSMTSGPNGAAHVTRPPVTKGSPTPLSNHTRHPVAKNVSKGSAASPVDVKPSTPHRTGTSGHSPTSSPKKNHNIDPIVRVERISSNVVMKKVVGGTLNSSGKELPSPQQPPPLAGIGTGTGVLGSTSGPGPGLTGTSNSNSSTVVVVVSGGNVGRSSPVDVPLSVKTSDLEAVGPSNQKSPVMAGSSKNRKGIKEKKILLCKDREYDPNKHCGVIVAETTKPCTRSLTCKTHSLSLRRAVCGRKKHFDELLSDHRATKEALVRASQQARSGEAHGQGSQHAGSLSSLGDSASSKGSTGLGRLNHSGSAVSALSKPSSKSGKHNLPIHRLGASKACQDVQQGSSSNQQRLEGSAAISTPKGVSSSSSSSIPDPPYITHHPKPAAMCTFGLYQLGNGRQLLSRHWELPRAAIKAALFSSSSSSSSSFSCAQQKHPPLKKLCLESRLAPSSQSLDASDPYRFTCAEANNNIISSPQQTLSSGTAVVASSNSTISTNKLTSHSVTRPVVPNVSNPQLARSLSIQQPQQQPLLSKATAGAANSVPVSKTTKPVKSNPKSDTNKMKNSSANRHSSSTTTTNHSAAKKRRTTSNSACNVVVVSTAGASVTVSSPQTVTIAAAPHPTTSALPLSFPLTIGEHLGALSRLQMSTPLVVSRNNLTIAPNIVRSQPMVTTANSKDNTVVMDVLNGQLPLLHSVTVSRTAPASTPTLLTPGPGGLGITLGTAGLMGQLTQQLQKQQQQKLATNSVVQLNSGNKVSNTNWSSGASVSDSAKSKYKSRKSKGCSNVTLNHHHHHHHHHHHTGLSSPIGLLIEGQPIGGSLLAATIAGGAGAATNSHISSSPSSSPSPILRTDGLSPLLANGLSSPTLCGGKVLNSGGSGGSHLGQHSPASPSSTPSPGLIPSVDVSSTTASAVSSTATGQGAKGKGRQTANYAKSVSAVTTAVGHSNLTFPVALPVSPVTAGPNAPTTAAPTQSITYQQVFASQMLTPAQISQLNKKNSAPTALTLTSATLPLKLLAPQQHHLFVKSDDPRRTEDPHSLPT